MDTVIQLETKRTGRAPIGLIVDFDTTDVPAGQTQRLSAWHQDGTPSGYTTASSLPTEFLTAQKPAKKRYMKISEALRMGLDPMGTSVLAIANSRVEVPTPEELADMGLTTFQAAPGELVHFDRQLHRSVANMTADPLQRVFARILPVPRSR